MPGKKFTERVKLWGSVTAAIIGSIIVMTYFAEAAAPWVVWPEVIARNSTSIASHEKQLEQITDIAEQNQWFQDFEVCQKLGGEPSVCKVEADREAEKRRRERDQR